MADQELKKQIKQLFSDLEAQLKFEEVVAEGEADDQLEALFSDRQLVADSRPAPVQSEAVGPGQQSTGTNPAGQPSGNEEVATDPSPPPYSLTPKQSEWVNDPMLRMAADPDPEVSQMALKTLVEMGEVVRKRALGLAQQPVAPLHRGVEAYFSYLLGQRVVYIQPGSFLMGSDPKVDWLAEKNEQPHHQLALPGYWITRYPVTIASFRAFTGHTSQPLSGSDFENGPDDYPVVDVTWHDALAYCQWLGELTGLPVALPSEAQWEKAARGSDGRRYPWGNHPPSSAYCSFERTVVGRYSPQGDSVYGCADMSGNVWEWTRSSYRAYPYQADDGREALALNESRVVRGVTFNDPGRFTRCAYRYNLKPNIRLHSLGFRLVIASV